jgi:molybdopterin synthase sulfur carrier subunit
MIIRYFAMLRDVTRQKEQTWNTPVDTVGELLRALCAFYGPEFQRWILDKSGNPGGLAIVLVNGTDYRELGSLNAPLKMDDIISIFPPVAGG